MAGELAVEMRLGRDVQVPRPTPLTGGGQHQLLLNAEGKCRSHGLSFRGKIILSGHVGHALYGVFRTGARPSDRKSIAAWRHEQCDVVAALVSDEMQ
jgi:hypothetical protein